MKYVMFDDLNSFADLDLICASSTHNTPESKTNYIEIPGRNGALDMSEFFGGVIYGNRTIEYTFEVIKDFSVLKEHMNDVCSQLHGKRFKILESDETHYYVGRVSTDWNYNNSTATLVASCECEPFRYKNDLTEVTHTVTSSKTISLYNEQMQAVPVIATSASMSIQIDGKSFTLESGTTTSKEIVLKSGVNEIEVVGTGTITFKYQEGKI